MDSGNKKPVLIVIAGLTEATRLLQKELTVPICTTTQ